MTGPPRISPVPPSHQAGSLAGRAAPIVLYLACQFALSNFVEGLKFGTCAVMALLHDVLVVWGVFAIVGYVWNWQIDSLFVTAMLIGIISGTYSSIFNTSPLLVLWKQWTDPPAFISSGSSPAVNLWTVCQPAGSVSGYRAA